MRKISDANAAVLEQYNYDDYGTPSFFDDLGTPLPGTQIGNATLFTGRRYDPESGLYDYRTRFYDSTAGRFITRDSIGIWGDGGNLGNGYAYVRNAPTDLVDPSGMVTVSCGGMLAGGWQVCCINGGSWGGCCSRKGDQEGGCFSWGLFPTSGASGNCGAQFTPTSTTKSNIKQNSIVFDEFDLLDPQPGTLPAGMNFRSNGGGTSGQQRTSDPIPGIDIVVKKKPVGHGILTAQDDQIVEGRDGVMLSAGDFSMSGGHSGSTRGDGIPGLDVKLGKNPGGQGMVIGPRPGSPTPQRSLISTTKPQQPRPGFVTWQDADRFFR